MNKMLTFKKKSLFLLINGICILLGLGVVVSFLMKAKGSGIVLVLFVLMILFIASLFSIRAREVALKEPSKRTHGEIER